MRRKKYQSIFAHFNDVTCWLSHLGQFSGRFLSKRVMNPSIGSRFSILSPTLNSHNFFENYLFAKILGVLKSYGPESFISGKKVITEQDWSITRHISFGRISQKLRFGGLHHPTNNGHTSSNHFRSFEPQYFRFSWTKKLQH